MRALFFLSLLTVLFSPMPPPLTAFEFLRQEKMRSGAFSYSFSAKARPTVDEARALYIELINQRDSLAPLVGGVKLFFETPVRPDQVAAVVLVDEFVYYFGEKNKILFELHKELFKEAFQINSKCFLRG